MTSGSQPVKGLLLATRPKTLWAGICPVAIGLVLAHRFGYSDSYLEVATLLAAVFIQIGTNFANDYFDFKKGTDTTERIGPARATQSGWVSPRQMLVASVIMFVLAGGCAVFIATQTGPQIGQFVIGLLIVSIICGVLYTAGPFPLGYNGLGDIFAFIFFGPIACGATFIIVAGYPEGLVFLAGVAPGAFAVAMIDVNNTRDMEQDRLAKKRTLAVLLGRKFAIVEYAVALGVAHAVPVLLYISLNRNGNECSPWIFASLLTLPMGVAGTVRLAKYQDGVNLNKLLAMTGVMLLLHSVLFCVGLGLTP